MLNLNTEQFQEMLNKLKAELKRNEQRLSVTQEAIRMATAKERKIKEDIRKINTKIQAAQNGILLATPLPKKVVEDRQALLLKMELLRKKSITVEYKEQLKLKIPGFKSELQAICPHTFVFHKFGYDDIPIPEEIDEGIPPSERCCVICGFSEKPKFKRFKILVDAECRIIQHEPKLWDSGNIWMPLGAVLHVFEKSVENTLNR